MKMEINIDISDAQRKIDALRNVHTSKEMNQLVYRAFRRAASKTKTILKKEIPKEYAVTPGVVGKHIGSGKVKMDGGAGGGPSCSIPIRGHKGSIGGFFKAWGGMPGWASLRSRRYRIRTQILRDKISTLPTVMSQQGGNPPFINTGSKKKTTKKVKIKAKNKITVAFTRQGKARLPIAKVVGIAVPQMPMNRAQDAVQENIQAFLIERLEHEHAYLISRCR